ncbi:hypothetical protein [Dyadobacter sp. CY326]|uniref:hypothetical protein n=1 Tax=Dyadobacter sp. CY326 TaxID=2907300 RepID=UPI001F46C115|nr:hypothetical protein [Dyadobacter sp. CY326]MCE7063700.1 hypothetical protein [Dyadobacter sp. CY326]
MKSANEMSAMNVFFRPIKFSLILIVFFIQFTSCKRDDEQDRLTGVYGSVVDKNGKGVDSVEVMIYGKPAYKDPVLLQNTYTNALGNYDVTLNVPDNFDVLHITVPSATIESEEGHVFGKPIPDSTSLAQWGLVTIGEKARIDFKLVTKW